MPSEPSDTDPDDRRSDSNHTRRHVLLVSAAASTALLAGCAGESERGGETSDSVDDTTNATDADENSPATAERERTGTFRLLVSDQPAAIGDFDSLDVSFDSARLFRRPAATETATKTPTETETETSTGMGTETAVDDDSEEGQRGFSIIDLDGATIDLTQLVGEKASAVFEGELPEGRYTKIELSVADVVGVVDDEQVVVKVPSGKLQITKPFTLTAGEPLDFVFDINVIRKGQGGYNLLPVISESGVAGEDVAVEEIGRAAPETNGSSADAADGTPSTETETATSGAENGDGGAGSDTRSGDASENGRIPDDA